MSLERQQFKAEFFKALSHPLRIKILEILADGEKSVTEMQRLVGSEGSAVSQQLSVLRAKSIVDARKEGTRVIYALRDPAIIELLDVARKLFNNHLINTISILNRFGDDVQSEIK